MRFTNQNNFLTSRKGLILLLLSGILSNGCGPQDHKSGCDRLCAQANALCGFSICNNECEQFRSKVSSSQFREALACVLNANTCSQFEACLSTCEGPECEAEPCRDAQDGAPCEPEGYVCKAGKCVFECYSSCDELGHACGLWDDGCGNTLNCGSCSTNESCDSQGQCQPQCVSKTCEEMGRECGQWDDGCENTIDCGECVGSETCNTASGQCQVVCVSKTCEEMGRECGRWEDGCENVLDCGGCAGSETCNSTSGLCQTNCVPQTCEEMNRECGQWQAGCENTVDCGECNPEDMCHQGQCVRCVPGQTTCSGTYSIKTCEASGHWSLSMSCNYGCNGDDGTAYCNSCYPDSISCVGDTAYQCASDGKTESSTDCSYGCVAEEGCASGPSNSILYAAADNLLMYSTVNSGIQTTVYHNNELAVGCNFAVGLYVTDFLCSYSVINFDVSSLMNKTILSAVLVLDVENSASITSPDAVYQLSAAYDPWDPNTVNWDNQPRYYTGSEALYNPPTQSQWILDVTQTTQRWANGTYQPYGFLLSDTRSVLPDMSLLETTTFYSTEYGAGQPELHVSYQ